MTLGEARDAIGARVIYTHSNGLEDRGFIIRVGERYAFVLYDGDRGSKATDPTDLRFA